MVKRNGREIIWDYITYLVVMSEFASKNSKYFIAIKKNSGLFSYLSVHLFYFPPGNMHFSLDLKNSKLVLKLRLRTVKP